MSQPVTLTLEEIDALVNHIESRLGQLRDLEAEPEPISIQEEIERR